MAPGGASDPAPARAHRQAVQLAAGRLGRQAGRQAGRQVAWHITWLAPNLLDSNETVTDTVRPSARHVPATQSCHHISWAALVGTSVVQGLPPHLHNADHPSKAWIATKGWRGHVHPCGLLTPAELAQLIEARPF